MPGRRLLLSFALVAAAAACGSRTGLVDELDVGSRTVAPAPDSGVQPSSCPQGTSPAIYVIGDDGALFRFDPARASFSGGDTPCPSDAFPYSMAVDRAGTAYVVLTTGLLARVETSTGACTLTPFVSGQHGFTPAFGMAFTADPGTDGDTLYFASAAATSALARIDTDAFALDVVGAFTPTLSMPELTGDASGELFAFTQTSRGAVIVQVDPATARSLRQWALPASVSQGGAYAFVFWQGDFYLFTSPGSDASRVTRFRPSDGTAIEVATAPVRIVGAGTGPCVAPAP